MRWLKGLFLFAVFCVVLLVGILFTLQNNVTVPVDLLFLRLSEQQLALWLFLAFTLGAVLGMLTGVVALWRLRVSRRLLQRQLKQREKEINQLRNAGLSAGAKS